MRLLHLDSAGQLGLKTIWNSDEIPPYAILSHTWGKDTEEVTLQELMDDIQRNKAGGDRPDTNETGEVDAGGNKTDKERYGYKKIRFCGEQARRDGLEYFWVDTCCIDKTNNAELSEAINSMFRWYKNAAKCYVYLADVVSGTVDLSSPFSKSWQQAFRDSRWFTRGWTLQELIAPLSVEFFASNEERLGDRSSLERQLHEITGIAIPALQGSSISAFSVKERMSWANNRQTKCPEDGAYSLLGIFDITLPLVYGEGAEQAFARLKEELYKRSRKRQLEELSPVSHSFNSAKRLKGSTQPSSIPSSSGVNGDIDAATKESLVEQLYFSKIDERLTSLTAAQGTTCRWFFTSPEYKVWQDVGQQSVHGGFLWIKGNPGTGKSTLMKLVFEEAKRNAKNDHSKITLSFFFLARGDIEEKSTTGLYRSLLHQLFQRSPDTQSSLEWMTVDGAKVIQRNGWNEETLKQTMSHAVEKIGTRSLTIFVDALDECDQAQAAGMISFFEELGDCARESQVRLDICFSSRHYPTIVIQKGIEVTLEDKIGHTEDIEQYIKSKLRLGKLKQAGTFRSEILERSSRIFLWVVLVIDILNSEHRKGASSTKIRARLKEIPPKLSDLFEMILTRYGDNIEQMQLCVKWILFASRPLKLQELYFAVQFSLETECSGLWDQEDVDLEQMKIFVRDSSKGLAEATQNRSSEVQFIHESVREFLLGRYESQWSGSVGNFVGDSHETLKNYCLAQLKVSINEQVDIPKPLPKASKTRELRETIGLKFPFLEYSVSNVLNHANCAQQNAVDQRDLFTNFPLDKWIPLNNALERHEVRRYTESASILYLLAERNLGSLIQICPQKDACFEVENERYGPPLFAALATNSLEAVQTLLEVQVDIHPQKPQLRHLAREYCENKSKQNIFGRDFTYSRLRGLSSHVAEHGDHVLLSFLCALGMLEVESEKRSKRTPLSYAASKGHEKAVRLLLKNGAQLEAKDSNGQTPLSWATSGRHEVIVKVLLDVGAQTEIKDHTGFTPLLRAIVEGQEGVVKLLLDKGAQFEAKDNNGLTPLFLAVAGGQEKVVKLLLDKGAQLEAKNQYDQTPLSWAAANGQEKVVKLLLDEGAQIEARDKCDQTPLSWAAAKGQEGVVKLLLDEGAQIEAKDNEGLTPLLCAAKSGQTRAVKLLLEEGAQLESRDMGGDTPLLLAASSCTYWHYRYEEPILKLLLEAGADPEAKNNEGQTPLSIIRASAFVSHSDKEQYTKLLLDKGAKQ